MSHTVSYENQLSTFWTYIVLRTKYGCSTKDVGVICLAPLCTKYSEYGIGEEKNLAAGQ
jgi:hypothetical protein